MALRRKHKVRMRWTDRLRIKYRLVFMTDDTLEERFTFRLSRLNVFVALGTLAIVLIFLTTMLIAFTPLREYIPGYTSTGLTRRLYILQKKTDSIERVLAGREDFIKNIRDVIDGKDFPEEMAVTGDSLKRYGNIRIKRSAEDSLLRLEVENQSKYNLYKMETAGTQAKPKGPMAGMLFFTPLKGTITSTFDPARHHFGVDVVARQNDAVKAVLDGTVVLSNWTLETGYVIGVQHSRNLVSFYKHNSANLKKEGDYVRAGDPVAIVGESGETATGPHLHFELWNDGTPVNPTDYITF